MAELFQLKIFKIFKNVAFLITNCCDNFTNTSEIVAIYYKSPCKMSIWYMWFKKATPEMFGILSYFVRMPRHLCVCVSVTACCASRSSGWRLTSRGLHYSLIQDPKSHNLELNRVFSSSLREFQVWSWLHRM